MIDYGKELQMAYDEGYKQGRYDEMVETEMSLPKRIPCSEGLPKDNTEVLMSLAWGIIDIGEYRDGNWRSEWINYYDDDDDVLAWMPLPPNYKGDEINDYNTIN